MSAVLSTCQCIKINTVSPKLDIILPDSIDTLSAMQWRYRQTPFNHHNPLSYPAPKWDYLQFVDGNMTLTAVMDEPASFWSQAVAIMSG